MIQMTKWPEKKYSPVILEEIDSVIKTIGACRNKPIDIHKKMYMMG
jgi:hypothetical protein